MVAHSPEGALGRHAQTTRDLLIEVVRSRHDRSADAHEASGSRYAIGSAGSGAICSTMPGRRSPSAASNRAGSLPAVTSCPLSTTVSSTSGACPARPMP